MHTEIKDLSVIQSEISIGGDLMIIAGKFDFFLANAISNLLSNINDKPFSSTI